MRHCPRSGPVASRSSRTGARAGMPEPEKRPASPRPLPDLPAPAEVLVRRSSGEQAALYIRRLIFDGVLREGDRVPQDAIAKRLGLSRIPVREALLSLEREGWVTIKPHRGAFLGALDETVVRDHYELYGHVFGFAAARAAERSTPEMLVKLADLQKLIQA